MALSYRQSRARSRLVLLVLCAQATLYASCATAVDPVEDGSRGGSAGLGANDGSVGSGGSGGFGGSGAFSSGGSAAFGPGGTAGAAGTGGAGGSAGIAGSGSGGTAGTGGSAGSGGSVGSGGSAGSGGAAGTGGVGGSMGRGGTSGSGGTTGSAGTSGAGGAGGGDPGHCLFNWRADATCGPKCTNAQPPQSDVRACAAVLDCWLSHSCGPSSCPTKPGSQDQYCGPNDIQNGGAPYPPAQAVWDCLMCP
jgi:hypothetical protein